MKSSHFFQDSKFFKIIFYEKFFSFLQFLIWFSIFLFPILNINPYITFAFLIFGPIFILILSKIKKSKNNFQFKRDFYSDFEAVLQNPNSTYSDFLHWREFLYENYFFLKFLDNWLFRLNEKMLELKNSNKIRDEDIFLEFLINFEKNRYYSNDKNFEINFKTKNSILLFIFNFYGLFFPEKNSNKKGLKILFSICFVLILIFLFNENFIYFLILFFLFLVLFCFSIFFTSRKSFLEQNFYKYTYFSSDWFFLKKKIEDYFYFQKNFQNLFAYNSELFTILIDSISYNFSNRFKYFQKIQNFYNNFFNQKFFDLSKLDGFSAKNKIILKQDSDFIKQIISTWSNKEIELNEKIISKISENKKFDLQAKRLEILNQNFQKLQKI